jgi:two-component system, cell cycle response regulator
MPNGFHNDPSIDQIYHRHTEHGHPRFQTRRHNHGFVSVHLEHHGGYVYEPHWDTLDLYPFVATRGHRPTRAEMGELAAELVEKLVALQSSNPNSKVNADRASGLVLLYNWCIVFGKYYVYTRTGSGSFELIVPPIGSRTKEDMRELFKTRPDFKHVARDTHVCANVGLQFHTPGECVYDLDAIDELMASTAPLHNYPEWIEMARSPMDSMESTGRLLTVLRNDAVERGTDHAVIRWRHPSRSPNHHAAAEAARQERLAAPQKDGPSGELKVLWGPHVGEVFWLYMMTTIGRSKNCDIVFDDESVSQRHATIVKTPEGHVLSDLGSTNGTLVNDKRTYHRLLEDGDTIRIGKALLEFTGEAVTLVDRHIRRHGKEPIVAAMAEHITRHANGEPLSLVLFDLDHFKRVNDYEGLHAGDAVLAHVQSIARSLVREQDTFARIGGEEFAIVLPGMDLRVAGEFAEHLRRTVEQSSCVFDGRTIPITISCGVAQWIGNINRPWVLFRQADNRLYEAKSGGRNQVRL